MPDGDELDVDIWFAEGAAPVAPVLVLFHGLEGGISSQYVQAFAHLTRGLGWHMVLPYFRGCSGRTNRLARAYHAGDDAEIDWILSRVRQQFSTAPRVAVGISLGGNALMRWAGVHGADASKVVNAVVAVCSPLDLRASSQALDQGLRRWLYARRFLHTMKSKALSKALHFPGEIEAQLVLKARTLREFDAAFTAPLHGFRSVDDYWHKASALPVLKSVQLPALLLNSQNDPFVPIAALSGLSQLPLNVQVWQPRHGGHIGFPAWGPYGLHALTMPQAVLDWLMPHVCQA
jgi:hypothetical protein